MVQIWGSTSGQAANLYRQLREQGLEPFLYHGRLEETQRKRVFQKIRYRDLERKPYLLITTPAIEVGVDLDAEVLITTLCPPENLLQRLGRVNRRGYGVGEVYVVGEEYPEYLGELPEGYLELLEELSGKDLDHRGEERLRQAIWYPRYLDPRAETLFAMLWEYVYGMDLTYEPLHRKGFLATRGWTPSVRVRAKRDDGSHEVEVPVDRLVGRKEDLVEAKVWERIWGNREDGLGWREVSLRPGELYGKEVVVDYPYPYDPEEGFLVLPKVFQRLQHPDPQRVQLLYRFPESAPGEGVVVVWYLADSAQAVAEEETEPEEGED